MTRRIDRDPVAPGRVGHRDVSHVTAPGPRRLKLGLTLLLGTLAGTMLFSTRAEGEIAKSEASKRKRPER